ncbi:3'-5' exoribonuclease [Leisingera caerulea]|uniref:3'-5' exoribonuclease n=1 Tax=Leisingera caerulea TaxID=506591 RepID=UPI0021A365CB|nr:3'-5' exoribonuclease [Leisingera caerulea]UWQ82254.1 3'-5' exoribonuclease [Leisingera caerulea]
MDIYFSADIETDGSIPGPYSMLSFALVYAGHFDGYKFVRPTEYNKTFYRELSPISDKFEAEALSVNGLDREYLISNGTNPVDAMLDAYNWVQSQSQNGSPVFVAYPLSFDWSWMYWYFSNFCPKGSPFGHSRCYDIKTALAVKLNNPVAFSGKSSLPAEMKSNKPHTHNALDDAIEQAEIFANIFEWKNN